MFLINALLLFLFYTMRISPIITPLILFIVKSNQKNILALLALLGPKEHQSYYRTPIEAITECTSKIIDNLPSLQTHWNPHKRREDIDKDDIKEIRECLKSFIPFDENKKQRPEQYKLSYVLGQNAL